MSKHAIEVLGAAGSVDDYQAWSDAMRRELEEWVSVSIIEPGFFKTNFTDPVAMCVLLDVYLRATGGGHWRRRSLAHHRRLYRLMGGFSTLQTLASFNGK